MIEIGSFRKKLGCFYRTSLFCQSLHFQIVFFREVIGTSVKVLKKMSSLEVVASSSLMLRRSKYAEKKRESELTHYIHVT